MEGKWGREVKGYVVGDVRRGGKGIDGDGECEWIKKGFFEGEWRGGVGGVED